jgi:hypothetical protein
MANVSMDMVKSLLKMEINIRENFIMVCYMEKVNLLGVMALNMKANLQIIELQVKAFIDGQIAVFMRDKLKMDCDMVLENILLNKLHMKENGSKERNQGKVK